MFEMLIALGVGVGGLGTGLGVGVVKAVRDARHARLHRLAVKLATLPTVPAIRMEPRDFQLVQTWAAANGMRPDDWAAKILKAAIPESERRRAALTPDGAHALDQAFLMLDEQEVDVTAPNLFGLAPKHKPPAPEPEEEDRPMSEKIEVPGHPCFHLSAARPPNYREGDCSGTCTARSQSGRICHWPNSSASNCPVFTPKVMMGRIKLAKTA